MNIQIKVVKGLFYGDEGKGRAVQWFYENRPKESTNPVVVKANGNSNAAHHVQLEDGTFWKYSQLNSASHLGAPTLFHPNFIIDLFGLYHEVEGFYNKFGFYPKLYVCRDSYITTPIDVERSQSRNSCCRSGLAETRQNIIDQIAPRIYDVEREDLDWFIAEQIKRFPNSHYNKEKLCSRLITVLGLFEDKCKIDYYNQGDCFYRFDHIIVECSQGVQLDQDLWCEEKYPYTTWSHTKGDNKYLDEIGFRFSLDDQIHIEHIGVMRWYLTRHGDGPFQTENIQPFIRSKEEQNKDNDSQGKFRYGCMDWDLFQKSLNETKVDSLFITHSDTIPDNKTKWDFIYALEYERIKYHGYRPKFIYFSSLKNVFKIQ